MAFGTIKTDQWFSNFDTVHFYWIGGTGANEWSDVNNWSNSSGGATPASGGPPSGADIAHFDANSLNNCLVDSAESCLYIDTTGYGAYTIDITNQLTIQETGAQSSVFGTNKLEGVGTLRFLNAVDLTGVTLNTNVEIYLFSSTATTDDIGGNTTNGTTITFTGVATWAGNDLTGKLVIGFADGSTVDGDIGIWSVEGSEIFLANSFNLNGSVWIGDTTLSGLDDVSGTGTIAGTASGEISISNSVNLAGSISAGTLTGISTADIGSDFGGDLINNIEVYYDYFEGGPSPGISTFDGCTLTMSNDSFVDNADGCVFSGITVVITGFVIDSNFNNCTDVYFEVKSTNRANLTGNIFKDSGIDSVYYDSQGSLGGSFDLTDNEFDMPNGTLVIQGVVSDNMSVVGDFTYNGKTDDTDVDYCEISGSTVTYDDELPKAVGNGFDPDGGTNNWLFQLINMNSSTVFNSPFNRKFNKNFN